MIPIPNLTMIAAGAIVVLSISNVILFNLYSGVKDEYAEYKAEVHANQVAILREIEQKQKDADAAVLAVSESWQRALDHARRHPPVRVLPTHCDSGAGLKAPGTSQGLNATAAESGLDSTFDVALEECSDRLNKAVIDAAQVLHLQADRAALCKVYGCE